MHLGKAQKYSFSAMSDWACTGYCQAVTCDAQRSTGHRTQKILNHALVRYSRRAATFAMPHFLNDQMQICPNRMCGAV